MADLKKVSEQRLEKEVVGTTFKVYLYMLKAKEASARQVYHDLGMSSPYLATHHLDKLNHLKLVSKNEKGLYCVNARRFGILRFSIITGKWIVPRTFFYTLFFSAMAVCFLCLLPANWNIIVFTVTLITIGINIIETIWFYRTLLKA
ncbi:MAG: hypothetical protein QXF52_06710 [Thermoproteota archaeon]